MQHTCKTSILSRLYLDDTTKRRFRKSLCIWNQRWKTHSVQLNTVQIQAYQSARCLSILARCEAGVVPGSHCSAASRCQLSFLQISVGVCPGPEGYGGQRHKASLWAMSYMCHYMCHSGDPEIGLLLYSVLVFYSILIKQNTKPFSLLLKGE